MISSRYLIGTSAHAPTHLNVHAHWVFAIAGFLAILASNDRVGAQVPITPIAGVPGVYIDGDGKVAVRETDSTQQLSMMRARLRAAGLADKQPSPMVFVSLPKLLDQARAARAAGTELPDAVRFVGGLTQIRYVFVMPEEKDLVIGGPAEPFKVLAADKNSTPYAMGTRTGHPVLQLEDLIVAMRTAQEGRGGGFGCGIYPSPESLKIADDIEKEMARNTRAERMQAMRERLGSQEVRVFGTRADTRYAFICVAADYELKRVALGLSHAPVPAVGNGIDATRTAVNKFWFEASYEPILVSADANSFQFRGQRLLVKAGQFDFDPRGETPRAKEFAAQFTKNMPSMCAGVSLFAELQNIADESLLANLIRRDHLAQKIGWDNAWVYDDAVYPVAHAPTPKTAEMLVGFTNGSLVAGGVAMNIGSMVDSRQTDDQSTLDAPRAQAVREIKEASAASAAPVSTVGPATRPGAH